MSNVLFNGLSAVHAGSNGTLITADVCKTPPLCVPIPYTNIAKSADAAMTATSVKVNGNPVCNFTSNFAISQGDSPGTCGGVISGTIMGMAEFITFSDNIFIEGIPAVRNTDKMVSNNKNTSPMPLLQANGTKPPELASEGPAELEAAEDPFEIFVEVTGSKMNMLKSLVEFDDEED